MTQPQSTYQRNAYPPNSSYYQQQESLPSPATSSRPSQPSQSQVQPLPGTFPTPPNSPPQPTPFIPELNGTKISGSRQEIKSIPKKEIYEYRAPWTVYGLDWSKRPNDKGFRLALGSFIEDCTNKLQIITSADQSFHRSPGVDFVKVAEIDHDYPITKILWEPYKGGMKTPDLLATTGDYLRLWEVVDDVNNSSNTIGANNYTGNRPQRLVHKCTLNNTKADFNAPLTSFDWNEVDTTLAVTSSIDTTCTVWNVETEHAKTQLIAHDREVYDVAFVSGSVNIFASVGADGSVRMFDLRALEHSTIIYEPHHTQANTASPLLRLCFNKMEANYLATFHMDSTEVQILDVRVPGVPVAELRGHLGPVNCVSWAPNNSGYLCSGGDDSQVLVWNVTGMSSHNGAAPGVPGRHNRDPDLTYKAASEISQLSWSTQWTEWVAIGFESTVQALKV
ncbi:10212_t:CDS:2 [Acaulospora morrowiae]|uniref:10212_t:CDS:1 n=1 Tax=Acaulospora morrowiae TaxID=94023 RepID=A0A9N8ZN58_9GLOM|nr:10212_t:CDS:2 [Acaulospora morrowiae]